MSKPHFPVQKLSEWFTSSQRDLPWRQTRDPYAIWISEVMLQQTQVATVIPYFNRWMECFPTVESLALASTEEVIKLWEGLGYYSRARNLHQGAKEIVERFQGVFPSSTEDLLSIKGIGSYTKGAIQSFAFRMRSVLVDGNVKRVLARFYDIEASFDLPKNHRDLESLIETILPFEEPWVFNEGLMELGALICTPKKPACAACPLKNECLGLKRETTHLRPVRLKRKKRITLFRVVFVLHYQDHVLVKKNESGIMQDLYEFPYEETSHNNAQDAETSGVLSKFLKKSKHPLKSLPKVTHGFTHHHVTLFPFHIDLKTPHGVSGGEWINRKELEKKPFSSGHRKILILLKRAGKKS